MFFFKTITLVIINNIYHTETNKMAQIDKGAFKSS